MPVRPANAVDIEAVVALHVASWRSAYRGIAPDAYLDAIDPVERRAMWERILVHYPGNLRVFEEAGPERREFSWNRGFIRRPRERGGLGAGRRAAGPRVLQSKTRGSPLSRG